MPTQDTTTYTENELYPVKDLATESIRAVDLSELSRMREDGIIDDFVVERDLVAICLDGVWHHLTDASVDRFAAHMALWSRVEADMRLARAA